MKTVLTKISQIILGILLVSTIILDGYAGFLFLQMGDTTDLFDKLRVATEYNIFEKLYLGAYLMAANMVLLVSGIVILVKTLLKK